MECERGAWASSACVQLYKHAATRPSETTRLNHRFTFTSVCLSVTRLSICLPVCQLYLLSVCYTHYHIIVLRSFLPCPSLPPFFFPSIIPSPSLLFLASFLISLPLPSSLPASFLSLHIWFFHPLSPPLLSFFPLLFPSLPSLPSLFLSHISFPFLSLLSSLHSLLSSVFPPSFVLSSQPPSLLFISIPYLPHFFLSFFLFSLSSSLLSSPLLSFSHIPFCLFRSLSFSSSMMSRELKPKIELWLFSCRVPLMRVKMSSQGARLFVRSAILLFILYPKN